MYKGIEVIGIDHGWSYMKTISHVFVTGVEEIATEPAFTKNLLEFGGKFYKIGGTRLEVQDVKTKNDNFFLLTLAAIAKELKSRSITRERATISFTRIRRVWWMMCSIKKRFSVT